MAATAGTAGSGEPDMALVGELLEEISRNPPAIGAVKLLVEHYISVGWLDAAMDNAKDLKRLAPTDTEVIGFLDILQKKPEPPAPEPVPARRSFTPKLKPAPTSVKRKPLQSNVQLPGNLDSTKHDFTKNYTSLRDRAKTLFGDLLHLQALQKKNGLPQTKDMSRIQAIAEGKSANTAVKSGSPGSARSAARIIQANPEKATELATADLKEIMKWVREPHGRASGADDDAVRDALVKRVRALEAALPDDLKICTELALMHIEHENLDRNYVNNPDTMLGDLIKDIPRENFYVTEDNYAWDMEELAQAITANGGVMRNPLSKIMFTPKDIKGIVTHQHGKALGALQMAQHEMSKGVRPDTITKMEEMAKILLEDQSADSLPSRHAVDEFSAYCATRMFHIYPIIRNVS
jgi:hypothetical protein